MLLSITNECFADCVHKFPSKLCNKEEMTCVENCADRYLKLRLRVGQKFQYYQAVKVAEMKKEKMNSSTWDVYIIVLYTLYPVPGIL